MKRQLGKEDAITAEAAARAYLAGTATATPKTEDSSMEGKTCAINQIKALLLTAPAALRERLGVHDGPMTAAKRALRTPARRIQSLPTAWASTALARS